MSHHAGGPTGWAPDLYHRDCITVSTLTPTYSTCWRDEGMMEGAKRVNLCNLPQIQAAVMCVTPKDTFSTFNS